MASTNSSASGYRLRCTGIRTFAVAAELLGPGDVAIIISSSGKLPDLLESAADAVRHAGADLIAITPSQSPLAKATVWSAVNHMEDSVLFLSMISRFLQLLFIDILSVGISVDTQNAASLNEGSDQGNSGHLLISHLDS